MGRLLKMLKKIFILLFIGFVLYSFRGIYVDISNDSGYEIKDLYIDYDRGNDYKLIGNIKDNEVIDYRILLIKRENLASIKYKIEGKGCFKAYVSSYLENGYTRRNQSSFFRQWKHIILR